MFARDIPDELHNDDGLAHPGSAIRTDLASPGKRGDEIHDFESRFQDLRGCLLFC